MQRLWKLFVKLCNEKGENFFMSSFMFFAFSILSPLEPSILKHIILSLHGSLVSIKPYSRNGIHLYHQFKASITTKRIIDAFHFFLIKRTITTKSTSSKNHGIKSACITRFLKILSIWRLLNIFFRPVLWPYYPSFLNSVNYQ